MSFTSEIGDVFDVKSDSAEYTVKLDTSLYIDSTGKIVLSSAPGKPAYGLPGGTTVNLSAIQRAMKAFGNQLPNLSPNNPQAKSDVSKFWESLNLDPEWLGALDKIREIAEIAGKVVGYVGAALSIAKSLGLLKEGPDPLQVFFEERFDSLERLTAAIAEQIQKIDLRNIRNKIESTIASVDRYAKERASATPDAGKLLEIMGDLEVDLNGADKVMRDLLDPDTWMAQFEMNEYPTWPYALRNTAGRIPKMDAHTRRFDHRLMVPMVIWGVHTFLLAIKALRPEYRSTGVFAATLRDLAAKLDVLVQRMRDEDLGWTEFTTDDFKPWVLRGQGQDVIGWERVVGGIDLCEYTAKFIDLAGIMRGTAPARKGPVNWRWPYFLVLGHPFHMPLDPVFFDEHGNALEETNDIVNASALASDANDQSKEDFGTLLFTSGYMNLVHLAGLLHHMSTEPDRSETVRARAEMHATREGEETITAKSDDIQFHGVISAQAQLVHQRCDASVRIHTQPVMQILRLKYRLLLRTLRFGLIYSDFYSTRYETDAAGNMRLVTSVNASAQVKEHVLRDWSFSPDAATSGRGTATLAAETFDIYLPSFDVVDLLVRGDALFRPQAAQQDDNSLAAEIRAKSSGMLRREKRPADFFNLADVRSVGRHPKINNDVKVEWDYTWDNDEINLSLSTRGQDRNYVLFLVIEELLASGTVLHSAVALPVTGAVTFVLKDFLKEEQDAKAVAGIIRRDVANHFREKVSFPIPPDDPMRRMADVLDSFGETSDKMFFQRAQEVMPKELERIADRVRRADRRRER